MGCSCSRGSNVTGRNIVISGMGPNNRNIEKTGSNSDNFTVESIKKDDLVEVETIKRELKDNASVFVLNNVLMSLQFFANHEELIKRLQQVSATPQEKEMNKTLLKDETMECTYPDAILEEVNKNIIYRTTDEYSQSEALFTRRIYVINDLIEVVKSDEIPQYTSIDKPCYQVKIEDCKRKGFLKLQQVENNAPILNSREYEEDYEPLPGPSSRSDSECDYSRITELRTPKVIEIDQAIERRDTLPETCFTHRKIKCIPVDSLEEDDEQQRLEFLANLNEADLIKDVIYINSSGVMKYFQNTLFPISLGKTLGFSEEAIFMAKAIPGRIFCDEIDIETNVKKAFEVIPAVGIPFPDDQTIEFVYREDRPTIVDRRTGVKYRWPTTGTGGMIEEIRNMSAVLVPKGYAKKKGVNRDASLEWEVNFPKAERYLEARMSHAQMKCMLLLLTLHKTFIAPVTAQNGLLPEHIRTHMYWQCERDYRNWPEHRLGTKLLRVIKDLQHTLFLGSLPHFFIKDRDLFENIPKQYLNYAQKVLLQILNNPVPYFVKALGNLRYTSGKFYPPLDLQELYQALKTKSSAALVNPQLSYQLVPQLKRRLYRDPDQQMKHLKYLKKKEQLLRERVLEKEAERKAREMDEVLMKEMVDVEEPIDKELDIWKTKAVLDIFIRHYIDIARKSSNIANSEQALFYLKQAAYLAKILEDTSGAFLEEIREYRQTIAKEEARIKRKSVRSISFSENKPPTPLRNSNSFSVQEINQQLKFGSIKLNNLQVSFTNGAQPPAVPRSLKPSAVQRSDSHSKQNGLVPKQRKTVAFVE
ncbi:uncharacterized protein LOC109533143 isoform X1 [Dendroctonus ponderosae]|uniref:uncharacterized protein LOC109533143 isoform X1 n=1 Tax=Dendroctonus ponderosae TaxID=77166 RepID=UPI002034F0FA|nr:uncharacterized protein LOC109533143 isoform X1 [Dendroctonus ponderosae]